MRIFRLPQPFLSCGIGVKDQANSSYGIAKVYVEASSLYLFNHTIQNKNEPLTFKVSSILEIRTRFVTESEFQLTVPML